MSGQYGIIPTSFCAPMYTHLCHWKQQCWPQSCAATWRRAAFAASGKARGTVWASWITRTILTSEIKGSAGKKFLL